MRDLLGLAEMESVDRFIAALPAATRWPASALLDELERDGRDLVAFADQVVARMREQSIDALSGGARRPTDGQRLARAARRLAGLDVNRGAAGGYRCSWSWPSSKARPTTDRSAERQSPESRPARDRPRRARGARASRRHPSRRSNLAAVDAGARSPRLSPRRAGRRAVAARARPPSVGRRDRRRSSDRRRPIRRSSELLAAWPRIVERDRRNPANRPLIAACRPVEVRDATVVLGFPESQAFLRDIAERKRSMLEEGIGQVLGRAVGVRCVATNVELVEPVAALAAVGRATTWSRRRGAYSRTTWSTSPKSTRGGDRRGLRKPGQDGPADAGRHGPRPAGARGAERSRAAPAAAPSRRSSTASRRWSRITIDPDVVDPDDVEMLQDLIIAAVNDGVHQIKEQSAQKMARVTGGLQIPGLLG